MPHLPLLFSLFAIALAAPQTLLAHGAPPAGRSIFLVDEREDHHDQWVYVTNFGVITPEFPDRYVCEEAFLGGDRFLLAPLALRHWVFFTPREAGYTEEGCEFETTLSLPTLPTDMALHQESGRLAITVQAADLPQFWESRDGGRSWEELLIDVGPLRPTAMGYLDASTLVLLGYANQEEAWGQAQIRLIDTDSLIIEALEIDPELRFPALLDARAGQFLWHARRGAQTEIYWGLADDPLMGAFFTPRWPLAGALSSQGDRAFLGGVDENSRGIFVAHRNEPSAWEEFLPGHRSLCLAVAPGGLYACGHRESDDHDLLFIDEEEKLLELLDFRDLEGPRQDCPENSMTSEVCPAVWPETAAALSFGAPPAEEDDPVDQDDPALEQEEPQEEQSSRCSTAPGSSSPLALLFILALLARPAKRRASQNPLP